MQMIKDRGFYWTSQIYWLNFIPWWLWQTSTSIHVTTNSRSVKRARAGPDYWPRCVTAPSASGWLTLHLNCVIWSLALPNISPKISVHSPSPPQSRRHKSIASKMARSKKNDKKVDESGSLQISLEDFIRARDLVSSWGTPAVKVEDCKQLLSSR